MGVCGISGVFAGLFGIGGGVVKGPLMIEMGVLPEVSAATASFMILFTSSTACASFASQQQIKWDYAVALCLLGLLSTGLGQLVVNRMVTKYGRPSIIVFIIGIIVAFSAVLMTYQGVL